MERNLFCSIQNTLKHGHFGTTAAHFINFISFSNWAKYWVKYVWLILVAKNIHPKVNRQKTRSNEICSTDNFVSPIFSLYL